MPQVPGKEHYRRYPIKPLSGGLNDAVNAALLEDGQTPDAENVDFDRESVDTQGGAIKFNNQPAPKAGILTRTSYAPLYVGANRSVPQRGYAYVGYSEGTDIGGDFAVADAGLLNPTLHTFHSRRGRRSFCQSISFNWPAEEKFYGSRKGAGAPASTVYGVASFDEGLEECTLLMQKGGDRLSPMSWALGIVNTGDQFEAITEADTFDRVSNYAPVFMWLDAPAWGNFAPGQMRYLLGTGGANVGTTGRYCTLAYRALIGKFFFEPGRRYHIAIQLLIDSGTPFDEEESDIDNPTATWVEDGHFKMIVRDDLGVTTIMETHGTDLFSWKGPADNYDYLTRYGVRFSGRDPIFCGLGYRFAPWNGEAFIPYGLDSAAMEAGGFRMIDVSAQAKPAAFTSTQTITKLTLAPELELNQRGMSGGTAAQAVNPLDPTDPPNSPWGGLSDGIGGAVPHQGAAGQSEALRNAYVAVWATGAEPTLNGGRFRIAHYFESGGVGKFSFFGAASGSWVSAVPYFIQVFRWHQRPLRLGNLRVWDGVRDWADPRTQWSLESYSDPNDPLDPNKENLVLAVPMDDAGGGRLRETVTGRPAYLAPYALGQDPEGGIFLSGEGERVVLDFADNPVLQREMLAMFRSGAGGFAIEVRLRIPQAYYARQDVTATENRSYGAPILASWEAKDDDPGMAMVPAPLLRLGHRTRFPIAGGFGTVPYYYPMGFNVEAATGNDQSTADAEAVLHSWASGTASNYSTTADWVGNSIRLQVGVEPTTTPDSYRVYLAMSPKTAILNADGDPPEAEFAYFTTKTIHRRELIRSVVVIGGVWRPEVDFTYLETNARLIVEDARVFGAPAPGSLPATSGGIVTGRDGKLIGDKSLPDGPLTKADLLQALGPSRPFVNVTEGSTVVTPSDGSRFHRARPEATIESIAQTYLLVQGDRHEIWEEGTVPREVEETYFIASVAAGGDSLTLSRSFNGRTGTNIGAASVRVIGYTSFDDDLSRRALAIGKGTPFTVGSAPSEAVVSEPYFANLAPVSAAWKMAVFSSHVTARDIIPAWDRGVVTPRTNHVLGMHSHQGVLYGVTQGCLYRADDRWRQAGPSETVKKSLAVLAREGILELPVARDAVVFPDATNVFLDNQLLRANPYHIDAWVWLDDHGEYQTILWVGEEGTDPEKLQGTTAGTHKVHFWSRLSRGYPEIAVGSTATYDGTNRPEKGFFVARALTRVELGEFHHVRWTLYGATGTSGDWVGKPHCYVNGRPALVRILASQDGAAAEDETAWVETALLTGNTPLARIVLGASRDSFLHPDRDGVFADDVLDGELFRPNRSHGRLHVLAGKLTRVAVAHQPEQAYFDPRTLVYATPFFLALDEPEGIGHKVFDSGAGQQYGLIESHPAISMFHEMGSSTRPASWARYGESLFVTNGGRPVHVLPPR